MNTKLEKKLFNKYPKLFRQKDLPVDRTAMCWGLQCDDGWYDLIDKVCEYLQDMINWNNWPQIEFNTVKEKFGGLRIYWDMKCKGEKEFNEDKKLKKKYSSYTEYRNHCYNIYEFIDGAISLAEHLSYSICELCGKEGKRRNIYGWVHTLCDDCVKKYRNRFKGGNL